MQKYRDAFVASTMLLLNLLSKNGQVKQSVSSSCTKLIEAFNNKNIDAEKEGAIIKKVYTLFKIKNNVDLLAAGNSDLFNLKEKKDKKTVKITIIPGIDIGSAWNSLSEEERTKLWVYLKIMVVTSGLMMELVLNDKTSIYDVNAAEFTAENLKNDYSKEFWETFPNSTVIMKEAFNPYVGVGVDSKGEYGVNELLSGPELLPDQVKPGSGVENMAKFLGVDKMLNMDELSAQLKNLTPEETDNAIAQMKHLLGNNIDEATSDMIDTMLHDISDELKKGTNTDNPMSNVVNIAETVAKNMMPKIDKNKVDMRNVWNQTKNLASNCQDKNGNPLFTGNANPLSMLTGFMEKQMSMHEKMGNPNVPNLSGNTSNSESSGKVMTEEDYMKECQKMMSDMGMPNISPQDLKNLNINQLMSGLGGNGGSKSKKSKRYHQ